MKKTKILVSAISAMIISSASIVYAKLPGNSLVIGGNAFDINYVFDKAHVGDVNKSINESGTKSSIYYIDSSGNIKNIFSPTTTVKEKELNSGSKILYKSYKYPGGVDYKLSGDEFLFLDKAVAKFNVSLGSIDGNKYVATITYDKGFMESDNNNNKIGAKYIEFEGLDQISVDDQGKSFIMLTADRKINFKVKDDKNQEIGGGQIDLSTMRVGENGNKTCELYKIEQKAPLETSSGNIQNSGEAMLSGEYIYYSNSADGGKLYVSKIDGTDNKVLSEDRAKYICAGDNGYIYYSNMSDNGKLYKIKDDGTGRDRVYDNSVSYIDKVGSDIYFVNISDGNKMYKLTTTSTTPTKVNDDPVDSLAVIRGEVYYSNKNDSNKLHKIVSGNSSVKALDFSVKRFIEKKDNLIIICASDGSIYKYDGAAAQKININIPNYYNTTREDAAYSINLIGNYIYYKSVNDGGKLYRVNVNGGTAELVVPYVVDNIYVLDSENLYITQGSNMNKLSIKMDSSGKTNFLVTPTSKYNMKSVVKIIDTLSGIETLSLPPEVNVEFNDHTNGKLPAYWDENNPRISGDETIYTGTLLGGARVQYRYISSSADILSSVTKNIIRNFNGMYTFTLSEGGIKVGDLIKIYVNDNYTTQQFVGRDGKVTFNNLMIPANSKISVSRKENGKTESKTKVSIINAMVSEPKLNSVYDNESVFNGADGRDITIKLDKDSLANFESTEVYIVPKGRFIDLINSRGLKPYNLSDTNLWSKKDDVYTGTEKITTDSMGVNLNNGIYDVYLVGTKSGDKYCSEAKNLFLKSELSAAVMTPEVVGDNFKAHNPIGDIKVRLNVKALDGTLINDITTNYDMSLMLNGEAVNRNSYSIENNNSIILNNSYLKGLNCGTYKFEVTLTDKTTSKTINAFFNVVVNSASDFKANINTAIFTKGYSPEFIEINLSGKDVNGVDITGADFRKEKLKDSLISVNDKPFNNFKINGTSIILDKTYLDTLEAGDYNISIVNKDIDLDQKVSFKIVDSQAEITPIIEGENKSFRTGQAENDITVSLNAKDQEGKSCEFTGVDIYYEGTKLLNTMYKLDTNKLTLFKNLLNQLSCGNNEIVIKGKTSTSKIIEGKLNISVLPAAELKFILRDIDKDKFTVGSSQDLTYDVIQMDENNKLVDRNKMDISNIKLQKGSSVLTKDSDYYVDNINKTIKLKKSYLDKLIAGDTAINVTLGSLSRDIIINVKEGQVPITAEISNFKNYSKGLATSDMDIKLTGISPNDVIKVEIIPTEGTTTYLNNGTQYKVDTTNNLIKITKQYLNALSVKGSKYKLVISDTSKSATTEFAVDSIARFKFEDGQSTKTIDLSSVSGDLVEKILEEDCDGKVVPTNLNGTTLRLSNPSKDLKMAQSDYTINGDSITINKEFLDKVVSGNTEIEVCKDGIVTSAKLVLKK